MRDEGVAAARWRVCVTSIDHVLQAPGALERAESAFVRGGRLSRVPVLRVFGSTPSGVRCCVHVHNAFPYCYVEYAGALQPEEVLRYIHRFGRELERALAASSAPGPRGAAHDPESPAQIVAVHLCKGVPFYGYHEHAHYFLKISYVDPDARARLVAVLESGRVMQRSFQPYEAHVPYQLQWMMDYNVYGCGYLEADTAWLREPAPEDMKLPPHTLLNVPRASYCALEIDVPVHAIVNRRLLRQATGKQSGTPTRETIVPSLGGLWREDAARRAALGVPAASATEHGAGRDVKPEDVRWQAHDRMAAMLDERIAEDKEACRYAPPRGVPALDAFVMHAFDTVELFHPGGLDRLAGEADASSGSVRMFDLDYARSQSSGSDKSGERPAEMDTEQLDTRFFSSQEFQDEVFRESVRSSLDEAGIASAKSQQPSTDAKRSTGMVDEPASTPHAPPTDGPARKRIRHENEGHTPVIPQLPAAPHEARAKAEPSRPAAPAPTSGRHSRCFAFRVPAPTTAEVMQTFELFGLPNVDHGQPHYSVAQDAPVHAREYAGSTFTLPCTAISRLEPFDAWLPSARAPGAVSSGTNAIKIWQYQHAPPPRAHVSVWCKESAAQERARRSARRRELQSQVASRGSGERGPRVESSSTPGLEHERTHMTVLALEVIADTEGDRPPDPDRDAILAVVYALQEEAEPGSDTLYTHRSGVLLVREAETRLALSAPLIPVESELDLLNACVDLVRGVDPEVLVGYDIARTSWGFLTARARAHYGYELDVELGRTVDGARIAAATVDAWSARRTSSLRVAGRHVLNVWRLLQRDVALTQYSLENCVAHLLHERVPRFASGTLREWLVSGRPLQCARALEYVLRRVALTLRLLEKSEVVFRTAEFARIYGIDFFSVLSRGSQYRVESMLLRIAKPRSYMLPSPSRAQVARQNAAECMPMIKEPHAAFYTGPLLVLDFQSLYPSMMIAYNLCYTTCLGRLASFKGEHKLGFTELHVPPGVLAEHADDLLLAPNGLVFVRRHVRESMLSAMLREVLDTRVMVRQGMRLPSDKAYQRLQNARQLSLKLLANVTYGYTGASFSGRMPCVEIADAIVQSGRETLERTIGWIEQTYRGAAQVVYGDTDSLFVYLPGKSREDAFAIGNHIAESVTAMNPDPVRLKFEKVYLPSVLVAKKRYVGYKFDAPDQERPTLDVKGLEIVRRDGHLALQRMQEACVRILFETRDLSRVKRYCQRQWHKIMSGDVSPLNLVIAQEVRLGTYAGPAQLPPGAMVAARRALRDPSSAPHMGERVPYLVAQGEPGTRLSDAAVGPEELLTNPELVLNSDYYIRRTILPALARIFNLLGADVITWFNEMPRGVRAAPQLAAVRGKDALRSATLRRHYGLDRCVVCGQRTEQDVCEDCAQRPERAVLHATTQLHDAEARRKAVHALCAACARYPVESPPCVSFDCPLLYTRVKSDARSEAQRERLRRTLVALEARASGGRS